MNFEFCFVLVQICKASKDCIPDGLLKTSWAKIQKNYANLSRYIYIYIYIVYRYIYIYIYELSRLPFVYIYIYIYIIYYIFWNPFLLFKYKFTRSLWPHYLEPCWTIEAAAELRGHAPDDPTTGCTQAVNGRWLREDCLRAMAPCQGGAEFEAWDDAIDAHPEKIYEEQTHSGKSFRLIFIFFKYM